MRTTIDSAGRIVLPKPLRDAMGLEAGRKIDVVFIDGHIEIELAPADVTLERSDDLPVIRALTEMPPLSDSQIRDALDATRR